MSAEAHGGCRYDAMDNQKKSVAHLPGHWLNKTENVAGTILWQNTSLGT